MELETEADTIDVADEHPLDHKPRPCLSVKKIVVSSHQVL